MGLGAFGHEQNEMAGNWKAFIASDLPVCCVFLVSVGQFPEISQFSYVNFWKENGTENITTFNGMITVFCVLCFFFGICCAIETVTEKKKRTQKHDGNLFVIFGK